MGGTTFFQIFLIVDAFVIGLIVPLVIRHGRAHFQPQNKREDEKLKAASPALHLSPEVKEQLLQKAQANFQAIIDRTAAEFEHSLSSTTEALEKHYAKLGVQIINDEMRRYHTNISRLHEQAETAILGAQEDVKDHQKDITAKLSQRETQLQAELEEKFKAQQQLLIQNIDTKLADAVASFLSDTLQHNVDLGAQTPYLVATLEEHKDELKKDIGSEI